MMTNGIRLAVSVFLFIVATAYLLWGLDTRLYHPDWMLVYFQFLLSAGIYLGCIINTLMLFSLRFRARVSGWAGRA